MNRMLLLTVFAVIASPNIILGEQLVGFFEPGEVHERRSLYIDGFYTGDVGDYIALAEGTYSVSYISKHDYLLSMIVEVRVDAVTVGSHRSSGGSCSHVLDRWDGARIVVRSVGANNLFLVELSKPVFRDGPDDCVDVKAIAASITPPQSIVRLTINATPAGVEVYRRDRRRGPHVGSDGTS